MRDVSRRKSMDVLQVQVRDANLFRDHAGAGPLQRPSLRASTRRGPLSITDFVGLPHWNAIDGRRQNTGQVEPVNDFRRYNGQSADVDDLALAAGFWALQRRLDV
jgi:hypothetical protein